MVLEESEIASVRNKAETASDAEELTVGGVLDRDGVINE